MPKQATERAIDTPFSKRSSGSGTIVSASGTATSIPVHGLESIYHTGNLDSRYYTESELNAGQLNSLYYTEAELNAGQLDSRYYTEAESNALFVPVTRTVTGSGALGGGGALSSNQTVTLNTPGSLTATTTNSSVTNHTHAIDSTIARSAITFSVSGLGLSGGGNLTANRTITLASSSNPGAADSILASNASGGLQLVTLTTTGAISGATNTNTTHTLGYATVGYVGFGAYASFAANAFATMTSYALLQNNVDGRTYLNSASGTDMRFRINNVDTMIMDANGLNFESGKLVGSSGYVSGWAGSGWRADQNLSVSGQSFAEFDNLSVRGTLSVYELVINQIRATNGTLIVSSAGKIDSVSGSNWTFEDPNASNLCAFAVNDLVIIQSVDVNASTIVKRIVRQVSSVSGKTITVTTASGAPADTGTAVAGDTVVRIGNTSNAARQGVVLITSDMSNSPYQDVISGVTSWADWTGGTKTRVRMGNLSGITGTANEYGLIAGNGYTSSSSYLKLSTSGVLQNNVNSTWRSGGTTFLEIDPSSGINITIPDDAPMYSRGYSFKNSGGTNISSLWAWYSTVDSSNRLELFAGYAARKNMIDIIASSDSTHDADVLLRAAGRDQQADMFMLTSTSGSSVNFSGITRLFSVDAPLVQFDNAANFWINANATADTYLHFSSFIDTYIKWTYSATGTLRYIDISAGATSRVRLGNGNGFSLEADSNEVYVNGTATINGAVTVNGNPITVSGVSQAIKLVASAAGSSAATYMSFFDSNDVRKGFVGDSSSSNSDIYLYSDTAGVKLGTATNADTLVVSGGSTLINQSSTTLADAALKVFQADASEEFVDWQGAVGAGNAIDTAALGSYYGKIRVAVNGTFKFMALYNS